MTKSEALAFFKEHEQWLKENWIMTPEGRQYAENFRAAIQAFEPIGYHDVEQFFDAELEADLEDARQIP